MAFVIETDKLKISLTYSSFTFYGINSGMGFSLKEKNKSITKRVKEDPVLGKIFIGNENSHNHHLFHKDELLQGLPWDLEFIHCHLHFKEQVFHKEYLEPILDILIDHGLMDKNEKRLIFKLIDLRYQKLERELKELCKGDQLSDTKSIINFIMNCKDTDILVQLHTILLKRDYDYLRYLNPESEWQGTNAADKIVRCDSSWAMIEESLELQMIENTIAGQEKEQYQRWREEEDNTISLKEEYGDPKHVGMFVKNHKFFSIGRKLKDGEQGINEPAKFFSTGSDDAGKDSFEENYRRYFAKFK